MKGICKMGKYLRHEREKREWKKLHTLKSIVDDLNNEFVENAFPHVSCFIACASLLTWGIYNYATTFFFHSIDFLVYWYLMLSFFNSGSTWNTAWNSHKMPCSASRASRATTQFPSSRYGQCNFNTQWSSESRNAFAATATNRFWDIRFAFNTSTF